MKEVDQLEDPGVERRIILKLNEGKEWRTGLMLFRLGSGSWIFRGGNECLCYIICRKLLGKVRNC